MSTDIEKCNQTVYPNEQWGAFHPHRCQKKAIKDGFCKIHHPDYLEAKAKAQSERWAIERDELNRKWRMEQAAPEMLEALKGIINMLDGEFPCHPMTEKVRAAISKAEGK